MRSGNEVSVDPAFISTLIEIAGNDEFEPAFRAQALTLPSEADVAREMGKDNDPDAIHRARNAVMRAVAKAGIETFKGLFSGFEEKDDYSPDAASAGRRSLRNIAMSYLSYAEETPDRAAQAFANASNMTDMAYSLSVLTQRFPDSAEASDALATFETRFADNALVMDKWFTLQAAIPGDGALARITSLMASKHFIATNPNRVRSLIGTFAFGNPTGFNRADGKAYDFLAEQIIAIDKRNPQLAARILTSMRSWRSLEAVRADHAREALTTIERSAGLSTDVRDIVERMLKG